MLKANDAPVLAMRTRLIGTSALIAGIIAMAVFYPDPLIGIAWLSLLPVYAVLWSWDAGGPFAVFGATGGIVGVTALWLLWFKAQC